MPPRPPDIPRRVGESLVLWKGWKTAPQFPGLHWLTSSSVSAVYFWSRLFGAQVRWSITPKYHAHRGTHTRFTRFIPRTIQELRKPLSASLTLSLGPYARAIGEREKCCSTSKSNHFDKSGRRSYISGVGSVLVPASRSMDIKRSISTSHATFPTGRHFAKGLETGVQAVCPRFSTLATPNQGALRPSSSGAPNHDYWSRAT